jgi:hypothetical protein
MEAEAQHCRFAVSKRIRWGSKYRQWHCRFHNPKSLHHRQSQLQSLPVQLRPHARLSRKIYLVGPSVVAKVGATFIIGKGWISGVTAFSSLAGTVVVGLTDVVVESTILSLLGYQTSGRRIPANGPCRLCLELGQSHEKERLPLPLDTHTTAIAPRRRRCLPKGIFGHFKPLGNTRVIRLGRIQQLVGIPHGLL